MTQTCDKGYSFAREGSIRRNECLGVRRDKRQNKRQNAHSASLLVFKNGEPTKV